jgi:hypothetical protein
MTEGAVGQAAGSVETTSYLKEYWCIPMRQEPFVRYAVNKGNSLALSIGLCEVVTSYIYIYGAPILDVSRLHTNDAPQSVGLLWTSDQLVAETST